MNWRASRLRLAILAAVAVAVGLVWTTGSVWSPWQGWVGKLNQRIGVAVLRKNAVPPCESDVWSRVVLSENAAVELPGCYDRQTQDGVLIAVDSSSTLPIVVSSFRGDTSEWMASGEFKRSWEVCNPVSRHNVFCKGDEGFVSELGLFSFHERLIVVSGAGLLIQGGFPQCLEDTNIGRSMTETLDSIAGRATLTANHAMVDDERRPSLADWTTQQGTLYRIAPWVVARAQHSDRGDSGEATAMLKPEAGNGMLTARVFDDRAIESSPALYSDIELPIVPFEYTGETHKARVLLQFIRFSVQDWRSLAGQEFQFPVNPEQGYIDGSVYAGGVHNPADITSIQFGRLTANTIEAEIDMTFDFGHEGRIDLERVLVQWTVLLAVNPTALDRVFAEARAANALSSE